MSVNGAIKELKSIRPRAFSTVKLAIDDAIRSMEAWYKVINHLQEQRDKIDKENPESIVAYGQKLGLDYAIEIIKINLEEVDNGH